MSVQTQRAATWKPVGGRHLAVAVLAIIIAVAAVVAAANVFSGSAEEPLRRPAAITSASAALPTYYIVRAREDRGVLTAFGGDDFGVILVEENGDAPFFEAVLASNWLLDREGLPGYKLLDLR
jgi:hypothetical protein